MMGDNLCRRNGSIVRGMYTPFLPGTGIIMGISGGPVSLATSVFISPGDMADSISLSSQRLTW